MNLRTLKTELLNKPTGRLILFLVAGAVILGFILLHQGARPTGLVTQAVPKDATVAKGYSIESGIPDIASSQKAPVAKPPIAVRQDGRPMTVVKAPPAIPQAIFATKDASLGEVYLPFGRLLKCELVNTVDSINLDTPIIGLITEDVWNNGRLVIPAGTEVHGNAKQSAARERIGSDRQWMLVMQDGKELPLIGTVLDYAPDGTKPNHWAETDGSAGLRGYKIASDKYAEAKAILAAMISSGAGAFPSVVNLVSPLTGGVTQVQSGGFTDALSAGMQAGGKLYAQRLLDGLQKDPYFVRVPAGTLFYLYVNQTLDLNKAARGLSSTSSSSSSNSQIK
ncbi:MAG: TrbI/VirB10 family protein [Chthoniobacterales bacterium]